MRITATLTAHTGWNLFFFLSYECFLKESNRNYCSVQAQMSHASSHLFLLWSRQNFVYVMPKASDVLIHRSLACKTLVRILLMNQCIDSRCSAYGAILCWFSRQYLATVVRGFGQTSTNPLQIFAAANTFAPVDGFCRMQSVFRVVVPCALVSVTRWCQQQCCASFCTWHSCVEMQRVYLHPKDEICYSCLCGFIF